MASFLKTTMRRAGFAGLLLAAAGALAQQPTMVAMPPIPLLPTQAGSLSPGSVTQKALGEAGDDFFWQDTCELHPGPWKTAPAPGACLPVLKEDGAVRLAGAQYGDVRASAYEFGDATGAYAAYTYLRSRMHGLRLVGPEARLGKGSTETSADANWTLVWSGTAVLLLNGHVGKGDLAVLVDRLPKVGGSRGLAPLLPTELVKEGLEPESVRYAVGPVGYAGTGGVLPAEILGWDKSAEAATASYRGRGTLTLLMYPTPQIAGDRGRALEKAVSDAGVEKFGTLRMRRIGPMIGVTSGAFSPKQADTLIAALHLDQEVTFDKKKPLEFHAEVRKTASLLQNIAVLCGVLILAAVLLGLFLGGARAGIRVLMGKPAASEPEFLTISLRDKPKALFSQSDQGPE